MSIEDTSPEVLREILIGNADTGDLVWKKRDVKFFEHIHDARGPQWFCNVWNGKFAGREALPHITSSGYKYGRVLGKYTMAHRVVWALCHGSWPIMFVDHINGDKADNRISNLRLATRQQNTANSIQKVSTSSRYKGVSWCKRSGKWSSGITVSGRRKFLGYYDNENDAALSYDKAALAAHGEYAVMNFEVCNG